MKEELQVARTRPALCQTAGRVRARRASRSAAGVARAGLRPAGCSAARSARRRRWAACAARPPSVDAVHVEIFVDRKVLLLPAGIGLRPPLRHAGLSRLAGGACAYPLHTLDPTGTVLVDRSAPAGARRPLRRLGPAARRAPAALVRGARARPSATAASGRAIPAGCRCGGTTPIVLEVGGYVPPHARYLFPAGQ